MKRKYFAYLHQNNHWVVKYWTTKNRFMEILQDGLYKNSCVKGIIMPFEIYQPLTDWEKELHQEGHISLDKIHHLAIKEMPALLHIKDMINRIDWNKG